MDLCPKVKQQKVINAMPKEDVITEETVLRLLGYISFCRSERWRGTSKMLRNHPPGWRNKEGWVSKNPNKPHLLGPVLLRGWLRSLTSNLGRGLSLSGHRSRDTTLSTPAAPASSPSGLPSPDVALKMTVCVEWGQCLAGLCSGDHGKEGNDGRDRSFSKVF